MKKLPKDFTLDRYGLHVRLAQIEDSPFILRLRTDPKLSRYLHPTENDLDKQVAWMRAYKRREADGLDYYFVYESEGRPIGVSRAYNIDYEKNSLTGGSWICAPGADFEKSIATTLVGRDIGFEVMGMEMDNFDVRKKNVQVIKLHKMTGARIVGETELDYLFQLTREDYGGHKHRILRLLDLE